MISKEEAQKILNQYVQDPYHLLHAKMTALAMKNYAQREGKDTDLYYITGLLHDIDYGHQYDINQHGTLSVQFLNSVDVPAELLHALQAHVEHRTTVSPQSDLDYSLIACDEVCGLIYAYSAIRPQKLKNLKTKSLVKCFHNTGFAVKIDRELILKGIAGIHSNLEEHLAFLAQTFNNFED
jgi:uncharacterized protein